MLRKRDELKFPKLFAGIRLRHNQGVLVFLAAETVDVETHLIKRIASEFKGEYEIELIPIDANDYAPFNSIKQFANTPSNKLFIINSFPYNAYFASPEEFEEQIKNLISSLNIIRDIIPEQKVKCIIICPATVEDRIALQASDFYHFKTFTASFFDDARFHNEIASLKTDNNEQLKRVDFLEKSLENAQNNEQKASIYHDLGRIHYKICEYENALDCFKKAENLFKKLDGEENLAAVLGSIGNVYKVQSDFSQALKYYKLALDINKKIGFLRGEANNLGNIGIVYKDQGDLEQALKYYKLALDINKKIGYLQGEAANLGNIGTVYKDHGDLEQALKYYKLALNINKNIGLLQGEAANLGNIGTVYKDHGDLEQALKYYKLALDINKKIGYLNGEAANLGNIGGVYKDQSDLEQALKYLKLALDIHKKTGYLQGEAIDLSNIGVVYKDQGDLEQALTYLKQAEMIYSEMNLDIKVSETTAIIKEIELKIEGSQI